MAKMRRLFIRFLRTPAAQHQRHSVHLMRDLHRQNWHGGCERPLNVPQLFASIRHQHSITHLQRDGVQASLAHCQLFRVGDDGRQGRLGQRAVARLALVICGVFFRAIDVTVAHRLGGGVAIHTIQNPLARDELRDRLIVISQATILRRQSRQSSGVEIVAFQERHLLQAIVAAIVAVIALAVGNLRCQPVRCAVTGAGRRVARHGWVEAAIQAIVGVKVMTGRTAGGTIEIRLVQRCDNG